VAYDPATIDITNRIDRIGVRPGAGCYLTYAEENQNTPEGNYLNGEVESRIGGDLKVLYEDLYKPLSLTQYTTSQVGTNRNHASFAGVNTSNPFWYAFLRPALSNVLYSDLTIAQAHGNGIEIGPGSWDPVNVSAYELNEMIIAYGQNWRLRKVALWSCFGASLVEQTGNLTFPQACGIRQGPVQHTSYMRKNAGLFFAEKFDQAWWSSGTLISTARAAEFFDQAWVCGKNQYPGGCDPTYSIFWAYRALIGQYPELKGGVPVVAGYQRMIYSSVYHDELMLLDTTHVKDN